ATRARPVAPLASALTSVGDDTGGAVAHHPTGSAGPVPDPSGTPARQPRESIPVRQTRTDDVTTSVDDDKAARLAVIAEQSGELAARIGATTEQAGEFLGHYFRHVDSDDVVA